MMDSPTTYRRTLKQRNEEFDDFLDSQLFKVQNEDLTEAKKAERRAKADVSDGDFCRIYFPKIFDLPDNALHTFIDSLHSGIWHLKGHRKSGKSARAYIGKAIHRLVDNREEYLGGVVNINTRTIDYSKKRCAALMRLIKRNKLLQFDYNIKITKESEEHSIVNSTHLYAGSVQTGLRHLIDENFRRIDVCINDDLTDKQSGKRDKERAVEFIEYEVTGQMEPGGLALNLFNDTDPDSPGVVLAEKDPAHAFWFPALADKNGKPSLSGESSWPEYRSTQDWLDYFKTIPYAVMMGDYQCMPIKEGGNFKIEYLRFVNVNSLKRLATLTACDPSFGSSPESCYKSLITLSYISNAEIIVEDVYLRREGYFQLFDYIERLRQNYPEWKILLFENDFSQFLIAKPYYEQWCAKRGKTLPMRMHSSKELGTKYFGTDKESRILNLVHPHVDGTIRYNRDLQGSHDFEIFRNQFLAFGAEKEKLDGLDAMATAFIMLPRWVTRGTFTSLKQRTFDKWQWLRG